MYAQSTRTAISGSPFLVRLGWFLGQIFSFEFFFLLFIFVDTFKALDPLPIDSTLRFLAISIVFGIPILLRQGLYVPGLTTFGCLWLLQLWVVIGYSWSVGQPHATADLMETIILNSWAVIAGALIIAPNPRRVRRLIGLIIVFSAVIASVGLYFYLFEGNVALFDRSYKSWSRISGYGLIVSYLVFLHSRLFTFKQLATLAVALACLIFLFVAGGRMSFLAAALTCLIPLFVGTGFIARRRILMPWPQLLSLLSVAGAVVLVTWMMFSGEAIPTIGRLMRVLQTGSDAGLVVNRYWYFTSAIDFWFEHPLTGHGFGSYPVLLIGRYQLGAQPHNLVLSILAEQGLIGLSLFCVFLWSVFRYVSYRKLCEHPILLVSFMLGVYVLLLTATDGLLVTIREHLFLLSLLCMRLPQDELGDDGAIDDEHEDEAYDNEPMEEMTVNSRRQRYEA